MQVPVIRGEEDHRRAIAEIGALWGAAENSDEGDRLDALLALVDSYETKRWPMGKETSLDPIDILRFAIDELGHSRAELATLLGSRSRASEILSRRRALTVPMIHALSANWKIPAELLVRPYALVRPA